MKMRISLLLLLSWLLATVAHAAQRPANDVSARVFNSADIAVRQSNPGEWQSLTFNSERWDTAKLHETTTNTGRLKAPVAGTYYIFANVSWDSPLGIGVWGVRLRLNGKTIIAEQTQPSTQSPFLISMSLGTLYALGAGDYVEVQVFQNTGGSLMIRSIAATSPEFGMARIP